MPARKIDFYLDASPELQRIGETVRLLAQLQDVWEATAPAPFGKLSVVTRLDRDTLWVSASTGTVAARLKQQVPTLILKLHGRGVEVTAIHIRVQAAAPRAASRPAKRATLTPAALEALSACAQTLHDTPLGDRLARLVQRHSTPEQNDAPDHHQRGEHHQKPD